MLSFKCIECTANKADYLLVMFEKDAEKRRRLKEEVMDIINGSPADETSPNLNARVMRFIKNRLGLGDIYYEIKKEYNRYLLTLEDDIIGKIDSSEDRLLTALKYAMAGNFIDFGAMNAVDKGELKRLIENAPDQEIDKGRYAEFREDLGRARNIVYLADNAGEIVFDKVFVKIIRETYPDASVTVVVRGMPIHNDATRTDAEETGMAAIADVIDNGTDIPGTELDKVNRETREALDVADVIISKGQGNFETLFGSGRNIYYLFLCKCSLFAERFGRERFGGIFINERNVEKMID
ncbi:MAG: hypothetical protein H6Q58_786 [Firmicutes bacterium]|nr:hypothetical protein [Bacillota bacterium]